MPTLTHDTVTVTIPDTLEIPAQAGKLSPEDILLLPKSRRGIGLACDQAAHALEHTGAGFAAGDVTPDNLRRKGEMAEEIDLVIASVDVVLSKLKQANLLLDAAAWEELRKLNDLVKAQVKHRPELKDEFADLTEYMSRRRAAADKAVAPAPSAAPSPAPVSEGT